MVTVRTHLSKSRDVSEVLSETRQAPCIRSLHYPISFDGLLIDTSVAGKIP